MAAIKESRSSKALARILGLGGEKAERVYALKIHRTMLWRYSAGRGRPDAERIAMIDAATDGEVAANGWFETLDGHEHKPEDAA